MRLIGSSICVCHTNKYIVASCDLVCCCTCKIIICIGCISFSVCLTGRIAKSICYNIEVLAKLVNIHSRSPCWSSFRDTTHPCCAPSCVVYIWYVYGWFLRSSTVSTDCSVVFKHNDGFSLAFFCEVAGTVCCDDCISISCINIWILECVKVHHYSNEFLCCCTHDLISFVLAVTINKNTISCFCCINIAVSTKKVYTIFPACCDTVSFFKVFSSPNTSELIYTPVSDLKAFEACLIKHAVQICIVSTGPLSAVWVSVSVNVNTILCHDTCSTCFSRKVECTIKECDQVCFQIVSWEYCVTSAICMVITSAFCGTVTREMLCEAVYGLISPSKVFTVLIICGLHSIDICCGNVKCKLRILTVCAA